MESYQQQPHPYARPPPPPPPHAPPSDPQYQHYQHQYPPQPPPPPPQSSTSSWNPPQYQYSPSPPPPPPPPPPHHQNQWQQLPPPPPPPHHHGYPPYPAPNHSYPNQDWGNGNWTQHSGWEYPPAHSNEDDWAAKAKAWASARSAIEYQQPQAHYPSVTQQEDPSRYANQYPQPVDPHFQDAQQPSVPTSGFSSYQEPATQLHRPPTFHQQGPASASLYASESGFSYAANDGVPGGDMSAGFAHPQGQTNSSVYQQEVPSSYSSIPGNEDSLRGNRHGNSLQPADGRVMPVVHPQFGYGNHPLEPMDQPLDFASRFSHGNDPKIMSSYPDQPGASYPPIAPPFPSSIQDDHVGGPLLPGQHSPLFATGPHFQPPVPSHVSLSDGMALHPASAFSIDAYGIPLNSERPKKAAVPNWLREEIIKTKATIASSAPEHFKEGSQSIEDDLIDKPIGGGDQADSKSLDSARSTEDDDEDEEVAQRTASINQEIKRVLTEVLLKVTDELFDEIATKVLSEDDHAANDDSIPVPMVLPPPPPVLAPKAPAKVFIQPKPKDSEEHASGETSSGSAGNVLGLANYASDEDDEIRDSSIPKVDSSGGREARENGHPLVEPAEYKKKEDHAETNHSKETLTGTHSEDDVPARISKDLANNSDSVKADGVIGDTSKSTDNDHKKTLTEPDAPVEKLASGMLAKDNSKEESAKRHDRHDSKKSSSGRNNDKDTKSNRERDVEENEIYHRRDERHKKKDRSEDSKRESEIDKKERSPRRVEKSRDSDSRKRSPHPEGRDSKYEREKDKKRSSKDADRKRDRTKEEKNDNSRHKSSDDTGRHKRRRSSSTGGRSRPIKESSILSKDSSDEASEDSRRKSHSKKRNLSPSPVRSRRRDRRSRSPVRQHRR